MDNSEFLEVVSPKALADLQAINAELLKTISNVKDVNANMIGIKTPSGSDNAIKKLNEAYDAQTKTIQTLQTQVINLANAKQKLGQKTQEEITNGRILASNANKQTLATSQLAGAYRNLSAQTAIASEKLQNIIARGKTAEQTQGDYNKQLIAAQKEFRTLQTRVLEADKAVDKWGRTGERSIGFIKNLIGAFGMTSGIYLFANAIKDAFTTMREFEKANADLAAFMGKTRNQISDLTNEQTKLAIATRYTAVEIAGVQKELAKSGFNNSQIKEATLSILNFASAIGVDLETSVQVTDTVLKTFGLSTKETTRINDIMAKSFSSSRLRIEDFKESIKYVAPIASSLNIPFEKIVSLLSILADNGIKGSMAGTSLRRILTQLTKSGGDFNQQFEKLTKSGITVKDAFDEVGRTAQTTLLVLSKHKDKINLLEESYRKAGGTADRMAKEQLNTLDGKIHILSSSWDAFIISLTHGDGVISKLSKSFVDLITETVNWYAALNSGKNGFKNIFETSKEEGYQQQLKQIGDEAKNTGIAVEKLAEVRKLQAVQMVDSVGKEVEALKKYRDEQGAIYNNWHNSIKDRIDAEKSVERTTVRINKLAKTYGYWNGVLMATIELQKKESKQNPQNDEAGNKAKKEKIALTFEWMKSEYELQKAIIQRQLAEINDRMNNDQASLDARLKARQEFSAKSIELLDIEAKEEQSILTQKYADDLAKNQVKYDNDLKAAKKNLKEKEKAEDQYHLNILSIEERYDSEKKTSDSKASTKFNDLLNQDLSFYKKINDQKIQTDRNTDKINRDIQIETLQRTVDNSNGENFSLQTRQNAYLKILAIKREQLDIDKIIEEGENPDKIKEIEATYEKFNKQLDAIPTPLEKAQQATKKWLTDLGNGQLEKSLEGIGFSSAKMFLDFDEHGQTTFDKLIEGAKTFKEEFAIAFQGVGDIAQDAFNKLSELSNEHFQVELDNLQKQKDISLAFAGDDKAAQEEIERQFEARQREIKRREFKAKKKQAEFNIIIDTAQGIANALATGNIPLSIIIGVLGALQLATVEGQAIPQYWKGTDNAQGGFAWTQEKGREIITDKNGRIKSKGSDKGAQLTYLNKGDRVLNNNKTMDYLMFNNDLNNILSGNSISSPKVQINNSGISDSQISRIVNAIENKAEFSQLISNGDLKTVVRKGNIQTEIINKRINFNGIKV